MNFLINLIVGLILIKLFHMIFKRTPDSRWKKVGKYSLLILLSIGLIIDGVISYQNYQELPKKMYSLKNITLGDSKSDVVFKVGEIQHMSERVLKSLEKEKIDLKSETDRIDFEEREKVILSRIEELKNRNDDGYVPIDESNSLIEIHFNNNKVSSIVYSCGESDYNTEINGIYCQSSGDSINEKYGNNVRVLCSKDGDETTRTYDVPKYNVRYYLTKNSVNGFFVGNPQVGINWVKCK